MVVSRATEVTFRAFSDIANDKDDHGWVPCAASRGHQSTWYSTVEA